MPPTLSTCFQAGIVVSPPTSQHVSRWGLLYPPHPLNMFPGRDCCIPHPLNMFPGGDGCFPPTLSTCFQVGIVVSHHPPSHHVSRWGLWYPPLSTCFQVGILVSPPLNMFPGGDCGIPPLNMLPGGDCGIPPPLSQHVYSLKGL